jgi:hypothetical protein
VAASSSVLGEFFEQHLARH